MKRPAMQDIYSKLCPFGLFTNSSLIILITFIQQKYHCHYISIFALTATDNVINDNQVLIGYFKNITSDITQFVTANCSYKSPV